MPFSAKTQKNDNNVKFIKKFFPDEDVDSKYPDVNYRVRMAELTNFWPYYSEAAKDSSETDSEYNSRVNTSGKLFENQFIVLNDIVHNDMDVSGMVIGQDYADHLPEALFYVEKCILLPGGKEYEVHPRNLSDENFAVSGPPQVIFPIDSDLSKDKGYYCYRKTSAVQKNNDKLVEIQSGWEKVAEFSNKDIEAHLAGVDLSSEKRNIGFGFIDSGISGYSGWTNELMTSYKVLDSGDVSAKESNRNIDYLRRSRTVNYISDPFKTYTLERKVSRASNSTSNPPSWELISPQAEFPYTDTEYLTDSVNGAIDFKVNGIYETIEPIGYYSESDLDYFQVGLMEDWGKSEIQDYTFGQDIKELSFKNGENLKLVQKGVSRDNIKMLEDGSVAGSHDIMGVVEASFSPNSTGVSGSITGSGNASNFYQLEYQLVPKERESKKLYYEEVSDTSDTISVGDRVFFNSGSNDNVYTPIETNVFGDSIDQLDSRSPVAIESASREQEEYIGPSLISGVLHTMEPEEVSSSESNNAGYSFFSFGEKYLVVPKGGYSTLDSNSALLSYSAGEVRSTFYQGAQNWSDTDENLQYALTEYRTFDPVNATEEPYSFNREREIRISDQSLCLGDSATELPDKKLSSKVFLLDYEYGSDNILRNASILNIDHLDGSIKKSNLISSKEEFERKPNLFFEKNYIGALTILATGQKQKQDASALKEIMSTQMSEGASVFYLERDIYVDSDTSTQANSYAPYVFSASNGGSANIFDINENTPNPQARGQEKLYLTETYHSDFDNYPFNDSSYFIKRPKVTEEFVYNNGKKYENKDFLLFNIQDQTTYVENNFGCIVSNVQGGGSIDGYGLLSYLGVSLTGTDSSSDPLTTGNYDSTNGIHSVEIQGFVPSSSGVYYEFQVRDRNASYNWETVEQAKEIHDGSVANFRIKHKLLAQTHANVDVRALEWNKSNITTNINALRVANESPDSLILKSDGVKFYDYSKFEHSITNTDVAVVTDDPNSFDPDVDVMNLVGDANKYISLASHRSFNIQNGNFSMEFWIKPDSGHSDTGYVVQRGDAFQITFSNKRIEFEVNGDLHLQSEELNHTTWYHVAVNARFNRITGYIDLSLFVNGKLDKSKEVLYGDLSGPNESALEIGRGLTALLYGVRIYIGKSIYREGFTKPDAPFEKDANPRSYKILKYESNRQVSKTCQWIINKNTFNNVSPPSSYKDTTDEAELFFMSEWVDASSTTQEMSNRYNRALINYINGYAYSAPNNPHINKNYEGFAIKKASDLDDIVFDNYEYIDRPGGGNLGNQKQALPAPYLYEYTKGNDLDLVRVSKKGGYDIELESKHDSKAFNEGSRLRITKYVYKLYTKRAVVVGDVGYKNNRGHQSGWDYQLQYSKDSGATWVDLEADSTSQVQNFFYNNEYVGTPSPDGFGNIDSFNSLPVVLLKTDITKNYKPEEIEFRISKKQNLSLGSTGDKGKVLKKLNFLPLEVDIPSANCLLDMTQQSEHSQVDGTNEAEVKLDPDRAYILIKDEDETILKSSDLNDKLQISSLSFSTTHPSRKVDNTDEVGFVSNTLTNLPDGRPVEFRGLTGLRITSDSLVSLGDIKTVIGPKPSGLILNRDERSYKGESADTYINIGESSELSFDETKAFITPSIIGSHFEELDDFVGFGNDDLESSSLVNFSCKSYTTGDTEVGGSGPVSTEKGVSGVKFSPLNQFYNSPVITSDITVGEEDAGKTFITSGNVTLTNNASNIEVANIHGTLTGPSAITSSTPIPTATIVEDDDVVIIQDSGRVDIAGGSESTNIVNIFSGDNSNIKLDSTFSVNEDVIFAEHGKINLTKDDAGQTIVIDSSADVILPSGFTADQTLTFLNATKYEAKVYAGTSKKDDITSQQKIGSKKTNIDYIPKETARKYTHSEGNWTASDAEIIKFNQLNLVYSDFLSTGNTVVHNEDVDIRISTTSSIIVSAITESGGVATATTLTNHSLQTGDTVTISGVTAPVVYNDSFIITVTGDDTFTFSINPTTGNASGESIIAKTNITENEYINIVRNQVNNFDIESDLSDWSTPIIRVYIDGVLTHIAPSGSLGIKITKTAQGWQFKKIKPIVLNEVVVTPSSHGKVYSYSGSDDNISMRFSGFENRQASDFKIFLISNKEFLTDINLDLYSDREEIKFLDKNGDEIGYFFKATMGKNSVFSISKQSADALGFLVRQEDQSNTYKFNQPNDAATRVKINRNDNFSLELPTTNNDFNYDRGFDLVFCNFSETSCSSLSAKEEPFILPSAIPSLKSRNYKYINSNVFESPYDNFKDTSKIKDVSTPLYDGDFVVLDGSLSDVNLKSFKGSKKQHKFSYSRFSDNYGLEGETTKYISFDNANDRFTLTNHELATHQKLVFNCDKLFVADHYHAGDPYSFNGTTSNSETATRGQSVLVFYGNKYSFYVYDGSSLKKSTIDIPPSLEGFFGSDYEIPTTGAHKIDEPDRIYVHIASRDKIYDFQENSSGLSAEKPLNKRISFNFTVNSEDYISDLKKQTFFVKVINEDSFELYKDNDLAEANKVKDKAASITFLSDTFYVEEINVGTLNVLNLGNSNQAIKNYSEAADILASPLGTVKESTIHQHSSNVYTNGDATPSGVYLASGYNDVTSTDTLNIDGLTQQDTIFLTGKFHAILDDAEENNGKYYINAGLDTLEVEDPSPAKEFLSKNRAYKYNYNNNTWGADIQNQNTAKRDLIYYPKNELHVLDRKYLSKADSSGLQYNFVFFKPDSHSDDLKIVLPNAWTNLAELYGSNDGRVAVVNLHDRPVRVENFDNTTGFTLNSDKIAWINSSTDYVNNKTEDSLFGDTIITKNNITYLFDINEDSNIAKVKDSIVDATWAEFFIMKPGDIIIDHSIHHNKKIIVDGPVNFLRPYLKSNDGSVEYTRDNGAEYDNKESPSTPTAFQIANISKDPVSIYIDWQDEAYLASDGMLYSSQLYSAELDNFTISNDYEEYFSHMTLAIDSSSSSSFSYPSSTVDKTKTYNIFGIELPLKLNVYASKTSAADAEKINQSMLLEQDGEMVQADSYYKISGIGSSNVSRLKIVNTVYENVRIESVAIKGHDDLIENLALASKIKAWFDEDQIAIQNVFDSYEISKSGGREWGTSYPQEVVPKFLPKDKALVLNLTEILTPNYSENIDGCSAFNSQDFNIPSEIAASNWDAVQSSFINIDRKNVVSLKKESRLISLADATLGDVGQNRSITCLSDPFDVVLPKRELVGDKDFDFIIVNGSHSSINIISPEGTTGVFHNPGVTLSVAAGKSKKISYIREEKTENNEVTHTAKTFADPVEIDTKILGKALFRDDLDVFSVTSKTSASTPFLISGSSSKKNKLKIINNTGYQLHIKATENDGDSANGTQKTIDKNKYFSAISNGNDIEVHKAATPFNNIRDGSVSLSEEAYKDEVVLFNSNRISLLDIVRKPNTNTNFFSATFVPFINDTKFKRYYPARTEGYVGNFTLRNSDEALKTIPSLTPVKTTAEGDSSIIDISCHLFEFNLKNVNEKVLYPNKDYDYIFTDDADFSCILYNGLGDGTRFFQLDSSKDVVEQEGGNYKTSDSVEGKAVLSVSQTGATVSVAKGQVYFDQKIFDENLDKEFLCSKFYLNKSFYAGKTVVFKDPFDIIYSFTSGQDYYFSSANTVRQVNISKATCYTKNGLSENVDLEAEKYYTAATKTQYNENTNSNELVDDTKKGKGFVVRPKYNLTANGSLYVLRHLADVKQESMGDLKIANITRGTVNVTYNDSNWDEYGWKIFSSERADFQLTEFAKDIYKDKKGNEITKNIPPIGGIYTKYSEVRKQDKRDWFVRLTDLDVPYLIEDPDYFNEQEWEMEIKTKKRGQINVDYNAVRYKFSNIFRTNKQEAMEGQTGFQSIEDYDDPYKFGITLLTNRRGVNKKIFFDQDVSEQIFPLYLKLPWDVPKDVIAYMLSTGHERLSECLHFNERNGEITLGGIDKNKDYLLESEVESSYDFTHSVQTTSNKTLNAKEYIGVEKNKKFRPSLIYNDIVYYSGQKISGLEGVPEYKLTLPYFSTLRVSQFSLGREEDSGDSTTLDLNKSQAVKDERNDLQTEAKKQTFNWNKVSSSFHENDFLSGKVESIATYHASDKQELILGRKIKDIDGSYTEEIDTLDDTSNRRDLWKINSWFRFQIPLNAEYSYTKAKAVGSNEVITIKNKAGEKKAEGVDTFTAAEGDVAQIDVNFIVNPDPDSAAWTKTTVESPGFEYKISSSLKYNRSSIPATKKIMQISLEPKDAMPFAADGIISSLNEDFSTPDSDEYTLKSLERLNAKYKNKAKDDDYEKVFGAITSLSNNQVYQSLKNNLGHSFVPAFGVTSGRDPMVGFTFNLKRNLRSYKAIRFRLKKLTDRQIVFDDFEKEEKLKDYFAQNATKANLRYELNTSIDSIAYQDIAHPGGVATMPHSEWAEIKEDDLIVSAEGDLYVDGEEDEGNKRLRLFRLDDCDAIVFKSDSDDGKIIAGKPYFLRLNKLSNIDNHDENGDVRINGDHEYDYDVLKIFYNDRKYDGQLKVNSSLAAGQKYKIVNYFDLASKEGEAGHRGQAPLINKLYPDGLDLTKYPSLSFPIIVGSKKFFLERPTYQYPETEEEVAFHVWTNTIWEEVEGVYKVRVNLELSEIAQALAFDGDRIGSMETFNDGSNATNWAEEDIFDGIKNILSRRDEDDSPVGSQMQIVSWNEDTRIAKINVKLTKGKEYRCLYSREMENDSDYPVIHSITINDGVAKTASFCDIFTATSEDFLIEVNVYNAGAELEGIEKTGLFTKDNKDSIFSSIYTNICLTESATFVDQTVKTDGDNLKVADYLDYQIPMLNNGADRDFGFSNPDNFYYTEGYDRIYTRGQREENLTDKDKDHGLMYDGPMPADIKYIYPRLVITKDEEGNETKKLTFDISNDYWNGFIDRFETESQYGSKSNRTKPKNIEFSLERLDGNSEWEKISAAGVLTAKRSGSTPYATVGYSSAKVGETYRLVVSKEDVSYYKEGKEHYFSNPNMRVPFTWRSTIFSSDVVSVENASRGVFEHKISLVNNLKLQKSIAFPENGVSKFGSYDLKRKHYDLGFEVPFTRLYMYRLSHSLGYVYVDEISQGGISKIAIDDAGANYRLPPIVSIAAPTLGLPGERTATANAQIESGKIKHLEIIDSGSGYSNLNDLKTNKFISSNWGKGATVRKEWLIQAAVFTHTFILNSTKTVTHDGVKNIIAGSYVSGTGIEPYTKVTKILEPEAGVHRFEISHAATASGSQSLTIDLAERQMPYIPFEKQFGVETAKVTLTPVDPAELDKEDPLFDDSCQQEFGIDFDESEVIAKYTDTAEGSDLARDTINTLTNYVEMLEGVVEDPNWDKTTDRSKTLGEISESENSSIVESNEVSAYGLSTEDEYVDSSQGTEHPSVPGLYTPASRDSLSESIVTIIDSDKCNVEIFPSIKPASLAAIVNNHSLAEYRVVENQIANKATPWISSFSRSQNPSLPKGFGINPGSPVSSEVFNTYARAVNNLYLLGAYVPIFAKVRKFRQYEYRYIKDMAGLTFRLNNPTEAGYETGSGYGEVVWEHESKINKIEYFDPIENKFRDAWFSADFGGEVEDENKYNIYDYDEEKDLLEKADQDEYIEKRKKVTRDDAFSPNDIGLPTVVNIPEEAGVFCSPMLREEGNKGHRVKGPGVILPELLNRRAIAFGGELVHSSEIYDVTDEDGRITSSIINIAGSDIVDTSYENEIVFGCQTKGKKFWSTFLKTTKEWTEFEIVPSPSFIESISDEETLGNLTGIKGTVTRTTTLCYNEEFDKVQTNSTGDNKHSLCEDGSKNSSDNRFSYEELFNLRDGDSIVGPVEKDHEIIFEQSFGGQGPQVFKLEPEFTQALAVYGSNRYIYLARIGRKSYHPSGPCIHKCSPYARAVFKASDEQLVFDLRSGSKSRPLNATTRMPSLEKYYLAAQESNKKKHASITPDGFAGPSDGKGGVRAQAPRLQPYVDPEDGATGGG